MDTLTFPSRTALVWALSVVAACGSDPATAPTHHPANGSDEGEGDDVVGKDDDATSDDTSSDSASMKDGGKAASKDAGGSSKMDAGAPTAPGTKDAGKSAADAGSAKTDAGALEGIDAGNGSSDAGSTSSDAGSTSSDAGSTSSDAGSSQKDAGSGTADAGKGGTGDAGATAGAGSCSGATPHGCYVPESDNPTGCPPQIHEQSAFYPPMDEWVACSSPYYTACNYTKPAGGAPAHCECDLGLHWLCTY